MNAKMQTMSFRDLKIGQTFLVKNTTYIKIESVKTLDFHGEFKNSVKLVKGSLHYFQDNDIVER